MPSKDPVTGKNLGGAALKRRRQAQKRPAPAPAPAAPQATGEPLPAGPVPDLADFAGLEPPPLGDPSAAISWANDVALIALHQVLRDPTLDNVVRWRWIKDLLAVVGMVRDKAAEQARLAKLAERSGLTERRGKAQGAKSLGNIQKPPTARRA